MNILIHNLKVAFRNLRKYKLQTVLSIASIAIGIVTMAFAHSFMENMQLPAIYYQPFHDRAYNINFINTGGEKNTVKNNDLIRVLKKDGGPKSAERIAVSESANYMGIEVEFHLQDSVIRKGKIRTGIIDPEYIEYAGFHSAITGENIKTLKPGEAIISDKEANRFFYNEDPIGAVQILTNQKQPIPVRIVDVYKSTFSYDKQSDHDGLYFCLADSIEDQDLNFAWLRWINVVLKNGYKESQLLNEINQRVEPLGLEAEISKALNEKELFTYFAVKGLIYLISSLILFAAIIGFLKTHTQLFMLRGREMTIRIVNGANWISLFGIFATEVVIPILFSVLLSLLLGHVLQDILNKTLQALTQEREFYILDLWFYSLKIGIFLIVICSLIAAVILRKIQKTGKGLAANMRKQRNHLFRNVMLGIQMTISIIFVCSTFIVAKGGNELRKACNVPENDDFYKECIYLHTELAEYPQQLIEEIKRLPEVKNMYMYGKESYKIKDVEENPEAFEYFHKNCIFQTLRTDDPSMISFCGVDVEWVNNHADRNECILIPNELYTQLQEFGMQDRNTLTIKTWGENGELNFPIAGVIRNIPYYMNDKKPIVIISSQWKKNEPTSYVIVPRTGKSESLAKKIDETIKRLEPDNMSKMVDNFRSTVNIKVDLTEYFSTISWILCGVSILICAMSILSTIALDTRGRRKEIAIRRINGAKQHDIYLLFSRSYVVMIAISILVSIPICFLFNHFVSLIVNMSAQDSILSPLGSLTFGIGIISMTIFMIVGWQTHRILQINPAKIIAKE